VIPLTVVHVYDFGADRRLVGGDLVRPEAWDALRVDTHGPFAMPAERAAWEADAAAHPALGDRAAAIDRWCRDNGIETLASYGVGGGTLELLLSRLAPERRLICTDYGPETVARLSDLFAEADVRHHDLRADGPVEADAHLFHRIDTELPSAAWHAAFERFAHARVLLIAAEVLDLRGAVNAMRLRLANRHATRAGWLRNAEALERLWRSTHASSRVPIADLHGWDLHPRS